MSGGRHDSDRLNDTQFCDLNLKEVMMGGIIKYLFRRGEDWCTVEWWSLPSVKNLQALAYRAKKSGEAPPTYPIKDGRNAYYTNEIV